MAKQLGFYVNQQGCMGCRTCQVACKDKNDLKVGQLWRRVYDVEGGGYTSVGSTIHANVFAYYISMSCNHCDDPACLRACPTGAMQKRETDGVVVIDASRCVGCKNCTWACPYGAPQYDSEMGKMGKCDLCIDLLAQGHNPACVDACPMRVLEFGPVDHLRQKYPEGVVELVGLPDPSGVGPNTIYTPHRQALTGQRGPSASVAGERR